MGKVTLLVSFTLILPVILAINIIFLAYLSFQRNGSGIFSSLLTPSKTIAYAALPTIQTISQEGVTQQDARVEMVRQFFAAYNSPLEPFAKDVVAAADEHNLDFRLIPAIAMQESNLCKKVPPDSHNCWGFGIYGKNIKKFDGYASAIKAVTKTLAQEYAAKGLKTPEQIMRKYTPSNEGSWARSVSYFMGVLQ
ncbi:MAG: hypothetical protein HYT83_03105 [Candidatus Levybacteria bacterium]|nr:hypothetical protein [Candidatus Levybacteria bacterium]